MKLYFSGVASQKEMLLLKEAGVKNYLADVTDFINLTRDDERDHHVAVDSGAYRAWKQGTPLTVKRWIEQIQDFGHMNGWAEHDRFGFITMPDVLGDPAETMKRWEWICANRVNLMDRGCWWIDKVIPVWQWGAPMADLERMLTWAKNGAGDVNEWGFNWACTVAVGGCVPWMRENDQDKLAELVAICRKHGQYLHILGLNWLEAIEQLDDLVQSCDTSKWIDGARYGSVITNEDGRLVSMHKNGCDMAGASREELMSACAVTLDDYCNKRVRTTSVAKSGREYVLDSVSRTFKSNDPAKIEARNNVSMMNSFAANHRRKIKIDALKGN